VNWCILWGSGNRRTAARIA